MLRRALVKYRKSLLLCHLKYWFQNFWLGWCVGRRNPKRRQEGKRRRKAEDQRGQWGGGQGEGQGANQQGQHQ